MNGWPYFAGADVDALVDPAVVPVVDPDDVASQAAAAAAATVAAQQLAAQQAALAAVHPVVEPVLPVIPTLHHHHLWQKLDGRRFRTRIGTPQDFHAQKRALRGELVRVAGETYVGAAELYFTVVRPQGATLRWQDASVMEGQSPIPMGSTFQGMLRPHDLIEVTTPGYVGWVSVYDVNQLGATRTHGDFATGVEDVSLTRPICPPGTYWDDYYGRCLLAHVPLGGPVATHGEFAGADGGWGPVLDQPQACAPGTWWDPSRGQCVAIVPPPPTNLPPTLADWHRAHVSGEYAGATAPPPNQTAQQAAQQAAAHAAAATQAAAKASSIAAHPAVQETATPHAQASVAHAQQALQHAQLAAQQPNRAAAREHARHAEHHSHEAQRHASFAREAGRHGGVFHHGERGHGGERRGGIGRHGRFAHGRHVGRRFHAHPEWHRFGHPAWRHGVAARWAHHRAQCARDTAGTVAGAGIGGAILGPIGALFGGLFGGRKKHCFIERIVHPEGAITYRLTPAGAQEGIVLDQEMLTANTTYEQQSGTPAPTEDDGPMPGSDDSSNGADEPDKDAGSDDDAGDGGDDDADAAGDAGDAGGAAGGDAGAKAGATAAKGYYAGWTPFTAEMFGRHPHEREFHRHHEEHGFGEELGGGDPEEEMRRHHHHHFAGWSPWAQFQQGLHPHQQHEMMRRHHEQRGFGGGGGDEDDDDDPFAQHHHHHHDMHQGMHGWPFGGRR
jgi:hypothetical protein